MSDGMTIYGILGTSSKCQKGNNDKLGSSETGNTKRGLQWSVFADIISEFSSDMQDMGYGESFEAKVIQAFLTGYRRQCELADTGARPLLRPRDYYEVNRKNKKLMSRDRAWLRPQYDLLVFYPATPDAWLVKGIEKIMREEGKRVRLWIKVMEERGTSHQIRPLRVPHGGLRPISSESPETFSFKVVTIGEKPLTRQLREAQNIANDIPRGQLIIGRNEHIAPAFQQMAPTDIP